MTSRKIKRFTKLVIGLLTLWFVSHTAFIMYDGLRDEGQTADVAVILGTTVNPDGTLSERLRQRLECGLDLYKKNRVAKIIVSGGFGKEGFFEGSKMKEYLVSEGIPSSSVIVDDYGDNTEATAKNAREICRDEGFGSVIVVSQYFHLTRTKMFFSRYGFTDVSSVSPDYFEFRDLYSLVREFFAFYLS